MLLDIELGFEAVADGALRVDDIGDATAEEAEEASRNLVLFVDSSVGVAEQDEGQPTIVCKFLVGGGGVGADADHFGPSLGESFVVVAEGTSFFDTAGGLIFGIKVEDDGFLAEEFAEGTEGAFFIPQGEGRRGGADFKHKQSFPSTTQHSAKSLEVVFSQIQNFNP